MKESILNIGDALKKVEQKQIHGGFMSSGCMSILHESHCEMTPSCYWAGCYCAPENVLHIPPCS